MVQPGSAYRGDEPYVFVCYAHQDKAIVYPNISWFQEQGINIWYDEGISPGEEWSEELGRAISGASQFLFFVTPNSVASRHCRNELSFAQNHDVPILAVHLRQTELPPGVELTLTASQGIFSNDPAYRTKLLSVLSKRSGIGEGARGFSDQPAAHTRTISWRLLGIFAVLALIVGTFWWLNRNREVVPTPDRSIVVEQFSAAKEEDSLEAYANGITEEVLGLLAGYHELRTIRSARTTPDISLSEVPSATYTATGTLQAIADKIIVRAKLIRATDGELVWSESLQRPLLETTDGGAALALRIARKIRFELRKDHECQSILKKSHSTQAAKLVCEGLAEYYQAIQGRGSDPQRVLVNAQKAITLDPSLVEGYHLLGIAYSLLSSYGEISWREAYPPAKRALEKALDLDPDNAFTLFGLGTIESLFYLNWDMADHYASRAIALDPLHPNADGFYTLKGYVAYALGNASQALGHCQRALNLNDANGRVYLECARALNSVGQPRDAIRAAQAGIELLPTGPWRSLLTGELIFAATAIGDSELASRELDDAFASIGPPGKIWLADSFAMAGQIEEAERLLAQLERTSPSLPPFEVWANLALGKLDRAFELMPSAIDRREGLFLTSLRSHPRYEPMRKDLRWQDVLEYLERQEALEATESGLSR